MAARRETAVTVGRSTFRDGRPCVILEFEGAGLKIRMTMQDGESLGEVLISVVRRMEAEESDDGKR